MRSEGYGTLSALYASLSVTTLVKALHGSVLRQRYVPHWYRRLFSVFNLWIIENFPSGVKTPIMLLSTWLPQHPMVLMQRNFAQ